MHVVLRLTLLLLLTLPARASEAVPRAGAPTPSALILYDSAGPTGWVGQLHGVLLANLLGHFDLTADIRPVETYVAASLTGYRAVFYLGTVFDNPLPAALLQDVRAATQPVCWFKYNLWRWAEASSLDLPTRHGFRFEFMDSSGYPQIAYRNETFDKDPLDPELGRVTIIQPALAQARAVARSADGTRETPYAVQSGRFWYVADSPFSYMGEANRYLVFADLLHDILEIDHPESHPALIRLEDITPDYPPERIREAADVLAAESVPFGVALIPVHADPLGVYNNGQPRRIDLTDRPEFIPALQQGVAEGGQIVLHGYTHQYDATPNPSTGVSGDDYEFLRVTADPVGGEFSYAPVPEKSPAWVQQRLRLGRACPTLQVLPGVMKTSVLTASLNRSSAKSHNHTAPSMTRQTTCARASPRRSAS